MTEKMKHENNASIYICLNSSMRDVRDIILTKIQVIVKKVNRLYLNHYPHYIRSIEINISNQHNLN